MGDDYSIADIATFPWIRTLLDRYNAAALVDFAQFTEVSRVLADFLARPAVQRGLVVP
jgi:GST-like protein